MLPYSKRTGQTDCYAPLDWRCLGSVRLIGRPSRRWRYAGFTVLRFQGHAGILEWIACNDVRAVATDGRRWTLERDEFGTRAVLDRCTSVVVKSSDADLHSDRTTGSGWGVILNVKKF